MKRLLTGIFIILSFIFIGCKENKDALTYIENNSNVNKVEEVTESKPIANTVVENNTSNTKTYSLNDYIDMRLWFEVLDGEDGITLEEATVLKNLCNNHEDFKMFEEALQNSIYKLYPELNN